MEITDHPLFDGVDWRTLADRKVIILVSLRMLQYCYILEVAPIGLHLPQFTYTEPKIATNTGATDNDPPVQYEDSITRPSPVPVSGNASKSVLGSSLSTTFDSTRSASSFIGFSWGPLTDAFPPAVPTTSAIAELGTETRNTRDADILSTPRPFTNNTPYSYSTPRRPYALSPYHTLQRTSTIRRSNAPRRSVSDREAMKQLVDCVGMSARKKVLESGRKPRAIGIWSLSGKSGMRGEGTGKGSYKELRFDPLATPIPRPDYSALGPSSEMGSTRSRRNNSNDSHSSSNGDQRNNQLRTFAYNYASSEGTNTDSEDDVGGPPSPSPRPGSAMSTMSMSRRSGTPTTTTMLTMSGSLNNLTSTGTLSSYRARGNNSVAGTSSLSIPSATSAGPLNLNFKLGLPPENAAAAAADGRKAAPLAIPSARRNSNPEPQRRSESLSILQNGNRQKATRDHDESGLNMSYLSDFQSQSQNQSQSQWDELEMRHAAMMEDIENLEERFQGLNASLMDGS